MTRSDDTGGPILNRLGTLGAIGVALVTLLGTVATAGTVYYRVGQMEKVDAGTRLTRVEDGLADIHNDIAEMKADVKLLLQVREPPMPVPEKKHNQ